MNEYLKGNYIYLGNNECGSPIREVKPISQKQADYWDRLEREIRQQEKLRRK